MFGYFNIFMMLSFPFSVNSHAESSPCVFSFMENVMEKMFTMRTKMEAEITEMKSRLADAARTPNVAFRVMLSKDKGQVSTGQKIAFDEVNLNRGNAYNAQDGVFTASYNGTYLFSMTLGNPAKRSGAFFLMQNGKEIEYVIAGHTTGWNMGGVTTVTELAVDDKVWVQGEGYVSGAYSSVRYHTSFSGVLLHKNNLP